MYTINFLAVWVITLIARISATPIPVNLLKPRVVNAISSDEWPTNVIFIGGSQTYGFYVPPDGKTYSLSDITCLGLPAYALGDCDDITVDKIGVVDGTGACKFAGINGWGATIEDGGGYTIVGPPQNIISAQCGI